MFGLGRKPGANAIVARGEIVHVELKEPIGYTVRVLVLPDSGASFEAEIKVRLRGTAGPMIGEETWVRYEPAARGRIEFDRERIKDRSYDRVRVNPGLRIVVDTLYRYGDQPVSVIATAR
ncbi:hypothetical protein Dvina_05045 [Dactylosporangium vinaceum]|uniref:Uncharacterized protein n=1 Tax=Dactylosporangium vinaceum TaxID=53362 RepID=A0ABV5MI96_9ACTN|nr:hypothetical protein [Dactylosporangium vinaceum]UAB97526.1 hypothetical protein Dvina_05045 [Dactylosporangium vinaceum]